MRNAIFVLAVKWGDMENPQGSVLSAIIEACSKEGEMNSIWAISVGFTGDMSTEGLKG